MMMAPRVQQALFDQLFARRADVAWLTKRLQIIWVRQPGDR